MAEKMSIEQVLEGNKRSNKRGCPVCGKQNAVYVRVTIGRLNDHGSVDVGMKGASRSNSVSFCEEHGIALWQKINPPVENSRRY